MLYENNWKKIKLTFFGSIANVLAYPAKNINK